MHIIVMFMKVTSSLSCRHVGSSGGGSELLRAVPPQVLSAVLTSPQLVGKKNIGNVDELFQLLEVGVCGLHDS